MPLRFLHISDIHFNNSVGIDSHLDRDKDIREQMLNDLKKQVRAQRPIDLVFVGGDIAFKGKSDEYEFANTFLKQVTRICGCKDSNVLVVPGNHDVDRSLLTTSAKIVQSAIKTAKNDNERHTLISDLTKDRSIVHLKNHLQAYFEFAAQFECLPMENEFSWKKELLLDGYPLRIFGLNSAFLSNSDDSTQHEKQLYLGSMQRNVPNDTSAATIVMVHHPPKWLSDGEEARRIFRERSQIQLYGHMHEAEEEQIDSSLVVSAGALHPDRDESGWEPRFNIIEVSVIEKNDANCLKIEIWQRKWNKMRSEFEASLVKGDRFSLIKEIPMPELERQPAVASINVSLDSEQVEMQIMNTTPEIARREIVYAFYQLSYLNRLKVAKAIGVPNSLGVQTDQVKHTQDILLKAKEMELYESLWNQIKLAKPNILHGQNPFTK